MNRDQLIADLIRDERKVPVVYDDKNGQPIVPGYTVIGHPTVGIGRALDVNPLTEAEMLYLVNSEIDRVQLALCRSFPPYLRLDETRQRVLANMAFNLGIKGLMEFHHMLAAVESGDFGRAADEMKSSAWYSQVGDRAKRLEGLMRGA